MSRHVSEPGRSLADTHLARARRPVGPAPATCFTALAPQYAPWLASSADAVRRGRRVTPAVGADDEQRSDEAPELHRYPDDRPQRIGQAVHRREDPVLDVGDVVGGGDHRPAPGEQRGAADRGDGLAGARAAASGSLIPRVVTLPERTRWSSEELP